MLNHHNKKQVARGHVWTDEQKRTLLKYAKDKTVAEISQLTGKDEKGRYEYGWSLRLWI